MLSSYFILLSVLDPWLLRGQLILTCFRIYIVWHFAWWCPDSDPGSGGRPQLLCRPYHNQSQWLLIQRLHAFTTYWKKSETLPLTVYLYSLPGGTFLALTRDLSVVDLFKEADRQPLDHDSQMSREICYLQVLQMLEVLRLWNIHLQNVWV